MPDEFDSWSTSTGLIDDVDVVITNAFFGYNSDYMNGEVLLMQFEFAVDDADTPEATQFYSCGNKWESNDKGKTAVREDGKAARFNANSNYGRFIDAAVAAGAGDTLKERGSSFEASVWIGLKFHVKQITDTIKIRGEDEARTRNTLLPTEYLGVVGKGEAKPTTAEASDSGSSSASSNGAISGALKAKLKKAATDAGNLDSFLEAAYGIDGVDGNKGVEDSLESFYAEVTG